MEKLSKQMGIQKSKSRKSFRKKRTNREMRLSRNTALKKLDNNSQANINSRRIMHRRFCSNIPIIPVDDAPVETTVVKKGHRRTCSEELHSTSQEKLRLISEIKTSFVDSNTAPKTSLSFYKTGVQLGTGAFGKVFIGVHRLTGLKVAIKSIAKADLASSRAFSKVSQEIFIMNRLRHVNISQLLEAFETPESILIVMEYVGGGDLLSLLKQRGHLSESEAKPIFRQLAEAVKTCHSKNIVHRDIKLENILMTSDSKYVKLCDFGVSRMIFPGALADEQCGTPAYLAPEILSGKPYPPFQVDVWSMGIVLFALLVGKMPFRGKNLNELQGNIQNYQFEMPSFLSPSAQDLLRRMICLDPGERLSIKKVLEHDWLLNTQLPEGKASVSESEIIEKAVQLGFNETLLIQGLRFKEINHATATLYLLKLYYNNKLSFL